MTAFGVAGSVILFPPIIFIYQVVAESNKHNPTVSLVLPNVACAIAANNKQSYTVWFLDAHPFSSGLFRQHAESHEQFEIRICSSPFCARFSCRHWVLCGNPTLWRPRTHLLQLEPEAESGWDTRIISPPPFTGKFKLKPNPFGTDSEWDFLKRWKERENYLKAHLLK